MIEDDDMTILESLQPSDEEFELGTAAAREFMLHCKRCKFAGAERHFPDGSGGEWVVFVEWHPATTGKAN